MWSNEGLMMLSGWIGTTSQAAMVITYSIVTTVFFVPTSFSFAMSALVGAAMGQGNLNKAKAVIWLVFLLTGLFVAAVFLLIQVYGYILVDIYTENGGIRTEAISNLKAYSLIYVLDSVQVLLSGITKGLGL
jgi:Na+-driven multidrug efflux pump